MASSELASVFFTGIAAVGTVWAAVAATAAAKAAQRSAQSAEASMQAADQRELIAIVRTIAIDKRAIDTLSDQCTQVVRGVNTLSGRDANVGVEEIEADRQAAEEAASEAEVLLDTLEAIRDITGQEIAADAARLEGDRVVIAYLRWKFEDRLRTTRSERLRILEDRARRE